MWRFVEQSTVMTAFTDMVYPVNYYKVTVEEYNNFNILQKQHGKKKYWESFHWLLYFIASFFFLPSLDTSWQLAFDCQTLNTISLMHFIWSVKIYSV